MNELGAALKSAVSKALTGSGRAGLLFSGGLDSAILAFLAKKSGANPLLITTGTKNSEDILFSRKIAAELGMELEEKVLSPSEIHELYKKTAELTGEASFMKIELGLLLLACCEAAKERGIQLLVSGAGAEELFLGYHSHSQKCTAGEDLESLRRRELAGLYEKDMRRSEGIAKAFGIRLALPFLGEKVVKAAFSIPAKENFKGGENKAVLRRLARELGVPESACSRRKRAMQYGSGIHAELLKLRIKREPI